jgi:DNA-binding MarR family transcriptional regulator
MKKGNMNPEDHRGKGSDRVATTARGAGAARRRSRRQEAAPAAKPSRSALDYSLSPFAIIESVLSPSGAPVLGLHLHVAHMALLQSFQQQLGLHEVTPNWIGILALVEYHPGISQIDLAKLIRLERASVGDRVARCISTGLIRRIDSPDDRRKYALYLTAHGRRILERLRQRIPAHETQFTAGLTQEERLTLKRLLDKLVPGWVGGGTD